MTAWIETVLQYYLQDGIQLDIWMNFAILANLVFLTELILFLAAFGFKWCS
jgi:hypothetical protein